MSYICINIIISSTADHKWYYLFLIIPCLHWCI